MNRFFKSIRYSSLGVFFAGISAVLQGCSVEREGALFAVLLFLLNFCSGPVEDNLQPSPVSIIIDTFKSGDKLVTVCPGAGGAEGTVTNSKLLFGSRRDRLESSTSMGTMTFEIGGDVLFFELTGTCTGEADSVYPTSGLGTPIDVSGSSRVHIPVNEVSGTVIVTIELNDGAMIHEESITTSSSTVLKFDLSDYALAGIDLTNIIQLRITVFGTAPLSVKLGIPNGFAP